MHDDTNASLFFKHRKSVVQSKTYFDSFSASLGGDSDHSWSIIDFALSPEILKRESKFTIIYTCHQKQCWMLKEQIFLMLKSNCTRNVRQSNWGNGRSWLIISASQLTLLSNSVTQERSRILLFTLLIHKSCGILRLSLLLFYKYCFIVWSWYHVVLILNINWIMSDDVICE